MFISRFMLLLSLARSANAQLKDRCGDCWCAPGVGNSCPTDETGIVDSFDVSKQIVLSSFVLTNDPSFLELQASDGSPCYPFTDTVGTVMNAPQTELPPCVLPEENETSVCAYKYNPEDTTCVGREYEVLTYESEEDALFDGAVVTHTGGKQTSTDRSNSICVHLSHTTCF